MSLSLSYFEVVPSSDQSAWPGHHDCYKVSRFCAPHQATCGWSDSSREVESSKRHAATV